MNKTLQPFVKWAGGKRQLLNEIKKRFPTKFDNYFEPFVGGGALFINLLHPKTIINDFSKELVDAYICIRDNPTELMGELKNHELKHEKNPKEYYYHIRALDRESIWQDENIINKTARFIYLNKSCFNGLYRVNKKGYFNVPFNNKLLVKTHDENNILGLSSYLKTSVKIINEDFSEAVKDAKKGDFIFFDPPYDLLKSDTFDSYNANPFGVDGQIRLANLVKELSKKGCYIMLTNHNTLLINNLYKDFNIDVLDVKRIINSDATNRIGQEVIIYNYNLKESYETKF